MLARFRIINQVVVHHKLWNVCSHCLPYAKSVTIMSVSEMSVSEVENGGGTVSASHWAPSGHRQVASGGRRGAAVAAAGVACEDKCISQY